MHSGKNKSLYALVTVLLYLLFGVLDQSGMVLCLEQDGRLKVEASRLDGSCCEIDLPEINSNPVEESFSIAPGPVNSCGDCIDLSLSMDGVQSTQYSANTRLTRLFLPLFNTPLPSIAPEYHATYSGPSPERTAYLQSGSVPRLRTVILLI